MAVEVDLRLRVLAEAEVAAWVEARVPPRRTPIWTTSGAGRPPAMERSEYQRSSRRERQPRVAQRTISAFQPLTVGLAIFSNSSPLMDLL